MSLKSGIFKNTFRATYKPTLSSKRKLSSSNDTGAAPQMDEQKPPPIDDEIPF